jgi:hypothetical protein
MLTDSCDWSDTPLNRQKNGLTEQSTRAHIQSGRTRFNAAVRGTKISIYAGSSRYTIPATAPCAVEGVDRKTVLLWDEQWY